ncbi:MAG: 5'-nucleotidase C-terminal domain-containing protein [Cyanobacteria bacterium P01_F01_bin.150]
MKASLNQENSLTFELQNTFTTNDFNASNSSLSSSNTTGNDDDDDDNDDDDDDDDNDDGGSGDDDDDNDDSGSGDDNGSDTDSDGTGTIIVETSETVFFGFTEFYIEGRSTQVTTKSTTLGILSAQANLFTARSIDASVTISLTHAGSISNSIGKIDENGNFMPPESGGISQTDIEAALASNYSLVLLSLTREELVRVIEYGVSASEDGTFPAQFPQVTGLVFSYDPHLPSGQRVKNLAITDDDGNIIDVIVNDGQFQESNNDGVTYRIVTTDFLADGGEGYRFSDTDITLNRVNIKDIDTTTINVDTDIVINNQVANFTSFGSQQDAFARYLANNYSTTSYNVQETTIEQDIIIQNVSVRSDTVINIDTQKFFFIGGASKDRMFGGNLADKLQGRGGNDRIVGRDGDDDLRGNAGNDRMFCGDGDDVAAGNSGNDRIICGDGEDIALGGGGNDLIRGGKGDDNIKGGGGNDRIFGNKGDDTIDGGRGDDVIRGDNGDDLIRGGKGDDVIRGGKGDDTLFGNRGDDILIANTGNTLLDGGEGEDLLVGGKGNDTFVIAEVDSTTTILNFNKEGEDILQFDSLTFEDLDISQFGNDTLIQLDDENLAVLINVDATTITEDVITTLNIDDIDDDADADDANDDNDSDNDSDDDAQDTVLVGTDGDDTFIIDSLDSVTTLLNFNSDGTDVIQFSSLTFNDLTIVQSDTDTLLQVNNQTVVIVANVNVTTITEEVIVTVTEGEDGERGELVCDRFGKPQALTFTYEPGTDVLTGQDSSKANVMGAPDDDDLAYIIVASKKTGTKDGKGVIKGKTYFADDVKVGDTFTADVDFDGAKRFRSKTFIQAFENEQAFLDGDAPLQTMEYHTSCSQPIALGDIIGSVELTAYAGEDGTVTLG